MKLGFFLCQNPNLLEGYRPLVDEQGNTPVPTPANLIGPKIHLLKIVHTKKK